MNRIARGALGAICIGLCAPVLSSCVAAAVPIMMAATAASIGMAGFGMYKIVQTSTGGKVRVAFGSADSKTLQPPAPLPGSPHAIAVWPGDQKEVQLAERLSASGRFTVATPGTVARGLSGSSDLKTLTLAERTAAFEKVCRSNNADVIFVAIGRGESSKSNFFSLKRGNVTATYDLSGYGCRERTNVWEDSMALVLERGGSQPNEGEVLKIAGDAWADRLIQAADLGGQRALPATRAASADPAPAKAAPEPTTTAAATPQPTTVAKRATAKRSRATH